ncbi:MAG: PQQ-binding-like beta-propeller repeat protein, partial [Planctomycetota bacterium]
MKDGRRISPTRALLGAAGALLFAVLVPPAAAAADGPPGPPADPIKHLYRTYVPPYVDPNGNTLTRHYRRRLYLELKPTREHMRLSTEKAFYSLSTIHREDRANALIEAAITKERQEQYRAALKMYQIVIDRFPDALYRVSDYGVFVPVAQYAQRRILQFPRPALEHYQTLHDPRAKEAFEQARRRYSLIGFSQIVDRMMATSYGDDALLELGNAALDQGHYLEALEHFGTIREYFRRSELLGEELDLRIRLCRKLLGGSPGGAEGSAADAPTPTVGKLRRIVQGAAADRPPYDEQRASAPHTAADDYVCFPPTDDPLGLADPVWKVGLPASRGKVRVFYQPVVTRDSVIYRHMNIVYCRSILNGELRWKNDLGGRVSWQNRGERQYPNEDVLVQDGLVFAPMHKVGPSLVALDEVTGQLRWAHGPVTASTLEEARMRFEAAPAGGPRTVYAGYVLDNIEGAAHTDTEYGVIAFESATGRVRWQRTLCRLAPGEFMAGFAVSRRNRIKSFTSPPLYHEGTVYYGTNAGVIVALDARSGRIKWLTRYPYWPKVHDAGRPHGSTQRSARRGPHYPMPWFNQRPLLLGERLLVLPVDSPLLLCLDRETGKVMWSRAKGRDGGWRWDFGGYAWLLGPTRDGHLVYVASGRGSIIHLLDQETGKVVWTAPDPILRDDQPVMNHPGNVNRYYEGHVPGWGFNVRGFWLGARPFLSDDGQLVASYWIPAAYRHGIWCYALACYSLADRAVVDRRRYYTHSVLRQTRRDIAKAKELLQVEKEIRRKRNAKQKRRLQMLKEIAADHVPVNRYGPFVPFARMTFRRYGVRFEMRMRARSLTMRYDPALLNRKLAARGDPGAEFAKAELDLANGRLDQTAARLNHCLATISSEDLDFRATINQILYQVHKRLARSAIRAKDPEAELEQALGMNRTAGTLHDEIETLFALADAFARKGDPAAAARALRSIVTTYGHYEHPIPAICSQREEAIAGAASEVFDRARRYVDPELFRKEFERTLGLLERSLPLYFSAVSPLPKDVKVRAGDRAVRKLLAIQEQFADFADRYERTAKRELAGMSPAEQQYHMWEFPGTAAAQAALDDLFARAAKAPGPEGRQRFWQLADLARVCRLTVPQALRRRVDAPPPGPRRRPLAVRREPRTLDFEDAEGTKLLVLKRRGERKRHPGLLFLGGRTRKRLDNKFVLICVDLEEGEVLWRGRERRGDRWFEEIRLKGKGAEPGFSEAFVCGDLV